jgi:hypothetical protein
MRRTAHWFEVFSAVLVLSLAPMARADDRGDHDRGRWFTAWSQSIGHRMGPAFTGANFART